MAFWVPYSDFKIGVEKKDIEEYIKKVRANELPIVSGNNTQQSFSYFIKEKMGLPHYQNAEIEIGYKDEKTANIYLTSKNATTQSLKNRIPKSDAIDLKEEDLSGLDFEGVTFNSTALDAVNFKDTMLFNSKFLHIDSKSTNIESAVINPGTSISRVSPEQHQSLSRKIDATTITQSNTALDNPQAIENAKKYIEQFEKSPSNVPIDKTFDILRYNYFKTSDKSFLNNVENTAERYVLDQVKQALSEKNIGPSWLGSWVTSTSKTDYIDKIKALISSKTLEALRKDDFLAENFYMEDNSFSENLKNGILDDQFITSLKNLIEKLPKKKTPEDKNKLEKRTHEFVEKHIAKKVNDWKNSQEISKKRTEDLKQLSGRKKYDKTESLKGAGGMLQYIHSIAHRLPDNMSPRKPSSYPAIDPLDKDALAQDLALKKEGAKLISQIVASATAGSAAYGLSSIFLPTGNRANATIGAISGLAANRFAKHAIDKEFTYENYKNFDNKLGDLLLEVGTIQKTLKPHGKTIVTDVATKMLLDYTGSKGSAVEKLSMFQGTKTSLGLFAAYRDYFTVTQYIEKQKNKKDPTERRRPGSASFNFHLEYKLFSKTKLFTALFVATLLVAASVSLVTLFPAAIPALTSIVTKAAAIEIGVMAVGAFAAATATTYLLYGVVEKGIGRIHKKFKMEERVNDFSEASDEDYSKKLAAAKTLQKAFKAKKLRKDTNDRVEKTKEKKLTERKHLMEDIRNPKNAQNLKKVTHAEKLKESRNNQGKFKITRDDLRMTEGEHTSREKSKKVRPTHGRGKN